MALLAPPTATGSRRGLLVSAVLAAGLWMAAPAPARAQQTSLETAVKASYLYKFAPFVDWPPEAFASPASPFVICVAGEDPFGRILDNAVRGQTVGARAIVVRRMGAAAPVAGVCHILFLGKASSSEALRPQSGRPVLTVTDGSRGGPGGMIQFVLQGGRVRFEIDEAAARANGVAISSKLLGLATSVKRAPS